MTRFTTAALAVLVAACGDGPRPEWLPLSSEVLDDRVPIRAIPETVTVDVPRARLGERLFHDRALSHDDTVACVDCHDLSSGGDEGNVHSALPGRDVGLINIPSIFNLRFQQAFSWSGRWTNIGDQIDAAMRAPHSLATESAAAIERIRPRYETDFVALFPQRGLTLETFHAVLGEYLFSLTTPGAPFDRFLGGDEAALTPDARDGWALFGELGCISCHQGVNVGGNLYQRFGIIEDYFAGRTPSRADLGRFAVTELEEDRHVFRVPSLRNVALTAPYFHDGSAATLTEAVQVMARYQIGRRLSASEVASIVAFLESLSGTAPEGPA